MAVSGLSSNWKKLQASLKKEKDPESTQAASSPTQFPKQNGLKRRRTVPTSHGKTYAGANTIKPSFSSAKRRRLSQKMTETGHAAECQSASDQLGIRRVTSDTSVIPGESCINAGLNTTIDIGKYLALDCEMVGIGPPPHLESALARVSIVNYNGECVYDSYVKPLELVTDWRTHVSGITSKHMIHARTLERVQTDVSGLIRERILVGHSIRGDFDALMLSHPMRDIRDTARHPPYRKLAGGGSPKLKILASELLGLEIQTGEHSSIEDARATMLLFRRDKDAFEREHAKKWPTRIVAVKQNGDVEQNKKAKKKKKKKK